VGSAQGALLFPLDTTFEGFYNWVSAWGVAGHRYEGMGGPEATTYRTPGGTKTKETPMPWTNEFNLPLALCRAIEVITGDYDRSSDKMTFSVTEVIRSPRITLLTRRHREEMIEDYADYLFLIRGSAVHWVATRGGEGLGDAITEERLYKDYGDFRLSGKSDLYHEKKITDWKDTSAKAAMRQDKDEWIAQPNLYAELYREAGFEVDEVEIYAILHTWNQYEVLKDPNYPKVPFLKRKVELWDPEFVDAYVRGRFAMIAEFMYKHDWQLPQCTSQDRWARKSDWALIKEGKQNAQKKEDTELELEEYIKGKGTRFLNKDGTLKAGFTVVKRPGRDVRCADKPGRNVGYCPVREWCNYYHNEVKDKQ